MAIEVKLPDLGEGIESGDVLDVLVAEGESISVDQNIIEVETDKATVEVPSTHAGVVTQIHVKNGDSVAPGQVLISVEASATATDAAFQDEPPTQATIPPTATAPAESPPPMAPSTPPVANSNPPTSAPSAPKSPPVASPAASIAQPLTPQAAAKPVAVSVTTSPGTPIPAGPAIRRFAREVGVDLTQVQGTGGGGRITRDDVLEVVRGGSQPAQATTSASPTPAVGQAAASTTPVDREPATPGTSAMDAYGPITIEKASKIRQTIASKMHESWSTVPRVTNFDDADVTELEHIRKASKADYAEKGIKLTSMPFIIKSVSLALRRNPLINAAFDAENNQIIYKQYVNVGIAVDTERGLVVPALRNTDQLSISEIARDLATTANNMREGKISMDALRGGTFTISNLGAIGGTYSTPIVNVPEVAILLIGRSRKLPVVMDDDQIAVRLMMPLSLSYDHRLVDGGTAARFLNDVIDYLESPSRLLMAP